MSDSETRQCQNCKTDFEITPDDEAFYQKIDVPPPTFCPECRQQRRLSWRNERVLYKNICKLCGASSISMYSLNSRVVLYCQKCWWSDNWDPMDYGVEYDFSVNFFQQFSSLFSNVPAIMLSNTKSVNSEYCNHTYENKNCYLNFASDMNEDSSYLYHSVENKGSYDALGCKSENLCYESLYAHNCYRSSFVYFSENCMDCSFMFHCGNCEYCFGCVNLKNAKYHIFNKKFTKEEYEQEIRKYNLGSYECLEEKKREFSLFSKKFPRRFAELIKTVNSTGEYLFSAKNCTECFDIEGPVENSKFIVYGIPNIKDCYDIYGTGAGVELCYEILGCGASLRNNMFSNVYNTYSSKYSWSCHSSSHLFGCVGLRNKEYCILNKQYTKEEYESLIPKIKSHMNDMPYIDKVGREYRYGEFFPSDLSPFAYNETIAEEYFPLTKNEALSRGFRWKDEDERKYNPTITSENLPDNIKDVPDSITNEIIQCAHSNCVHQCTTAFKIIPEELQFYKRMNLPIPRLCPNCRHYERLSQRNPLKLWHRQCMKEGCTNEFQTSYDPSRPEIVYCETCYQNEVN